MSKIPRLNGILKEELAAAVNREIGLPNVLITITSVECSPDLKRAKVGVSILPDNLAGTALRRLAAATGELVKILKSRVKLRQVPHFIWEFDATEREAGKIEKLIAGINKDDDEKNEVGSKEE